MRLLIQLCILSEILIGLFTFKVINVISENGSIYGTYLITNNWAKQFDDLNTTSLFLLDGRTKVRNMTRHHFYSNYTISPEKIPLISLQDLGSDEVLRVALLKSKYINGDLIQDIRFIGARLLLLQLNV